MKLNIFTSTRNDGIMSKNKKYFKNLTTEERNILYSSTLERFFNKYNLDYKNLIIINEKNNINSSRIVTKENKKIKETVLVLKDTLPNYVVAVETTDAPIVVANAKTPDDKNVTAISLATIENLNNNILRLMVDTLMKETDAAPFEMTFYIGPCPSKDNYELKNIDKLTSSIFKDAVEKKNNKYYLDIRYVIFNDLLKEIVDPNNIYFNEEDTTTSNKYFSDLNNKPGKHLECVVYNEEV